MLRTGGRPEASQSFFMAHDGLPTPKQDAEERAIAAVHAATGSGSDA